MDAIFQRLALKGKAKWVTYNHAAFDAATIKTPDNGFLLLRQIIFNPFVDATAGGDNSKDVLDHTIFGLSLNEKGTSEELYYNLRTPVIPYQDGGKWYGAITASPLIIDTFKVFTKDILIDIARIPAMSALTQTSAKFVVNAEERQSPLGFGVGATGINVIGEVDFPAASAKYFPNGDSRQITGLNAFTAAKFQDQFRVLINAANRLNPAPANAALAGQNMAPFITFGCWKISGSPSEIADLF